MLAKNRRKIVKNSEKRLKTIQKALKLLINEKFRLVFHQVLKNLPLHDNLLLY